MAAPIAGQPAAPGENRAPFQFGDIYNYERLEELGSGSYGTVSKARDLRTQEIVAVKWIRSPYGEGTPDLTAVFREAHFLAACGGHPSVVQLKEVAFDHNTGGVFIVMEYVGPNLQILILRGWPYPEAETRTRMHQLLCGIAKMHSVGIIHRDLKPNNVLIGEGGALKICDLGMATPMNAPGVPYPEYRVGAMWYRAPELLLGCRTYGPAVDMWSLGCVMAEMLISVPLFERAEDELGMYARVMFMASKESQVFKVILPKLSEACREVLCGLLCVDPDKRLTAVEALNHRWFKDEK